jgi:hypothetical protein
VAAPEFKIETLDVQKHRRETFECESEALTVFLRERARREMDARTSICFVMTPLDDPGRIVGYYTLSSASILFAKLPPPFTKRLPRYPEVPATLLGRLARHIAFKGRSLGELLMLSAFQRSWDPSAKIGSVALVTDPKDDAARRFYERFGLAPLDESRLFIPMLQIGQHLKSS